MLRPHGRPYRGGLAPLLDVHSRPQSPPKSSSPQPRRRRATAPCSPPPKRAFDPNFNSDTETYEGDVAFLLEVELEEGRPRRPRRARPLRPLPDLQSQNVRALQVERLRHPHRRSGRRRPAAIVIPAGYSEPKAPTANPATSTVRPHRPARRPRRLSRRRLRLRPRLHLHALRLPHDPDHDVLLPQPPVRRTPREHRAGARLLPRNHRALLRTRPGHHRDPRTVRHRHPRLQSLGQRLHLAPLHRLRPEPAGRLRNHHPLGPSSRRSISPPTRAASSAACSWA